MLRNLCALLLISSARAADVVNIDITSDKSTTGKAAIPTTVAAMCTFRAVAPRSFVPDPCASAGSHCRGWRRSGYRPQHRHCDRHRYRLQGGSDPTNGHDREGAEGHAPCWCCRRRAQNHAQLCLRGYAAYSSDHLRGSLWSCVRLGRSRGCLWRRLMRCVLPSRHVRQPGGRFQARMPGLQRLPYNGDRVPGGLGCSLTRQRCSGHDAARRDDYRASPWAPLLS